MENEKPLDATLFIIFGAAGDLTRRKLIPALYNLYLNGWMPERFEVIGTSSREINDVKFRDRLRDGVNQSSQRGKVKDEDWKNFAQCLHIIKMDLADAKAYRNLAKKLADREKKWNAEANRIFYLALPPSMIEPVARHMSGAKLNQKRKRARIVIEKPFGHDLESAGKLNRLLTGIFEERQIFRIDHYLGKETVQNILDFRFGNTLFEPIWNRQYIDHIQITVAEDQGIGHRGRYYDKAGTWGQEESDVLIAQDGFSWITPTMLKCQKDASVCRIITEPLP
jgi:glucose-6-phosphate 1-dehydrogenase